ncbi:HECT-like ubiquitin-conjugating enzyme-binding-domain-containing protein [Chlamydoabsidia padenii]|nr:HECT-like ubiquitin-conjugating enzyme-binding-domain-containing protein [Chlamydoabsidia padenii]
MPIPFYAEILSNIQVLRATITLDDLIDSTLLVVKNNNQLWLEDTLVVDLAHFGIQVVPSSLLVQPDTDHQHLYQLKLNLTHSDRSILEDKQWWTASSLPTQHIKCRHCHHDLVNKNSTSFQCKNLPSEHWYELVECWICHEAKPEEHQSRMRPILAKPEVLLVGSFYFLVHSSDLDPIIELDKEIANKVDWNRGTMTKWISVNCGDCGKVVGEGQYERKQDESSLNLMAVKLYKYCVTLQPTPGELPGFIDFVVGDLIEAAKVHATHRFIIQGKKSNRVHALIWLFNWDTTIVYNDGYTDDADEVSEKITCQRGMKVLYANTKDNGDSVKMWTHDKSTDHLIYPDVYCEQLVKFLQATTDVLPPTLRTMNHPAMPMTKHFSVGFLPRSLRQ